MPNFIYIYEQYRDLGLSHKDARANTLENAADYCVSASQRVRLSYYINKLGWGLK
jgi:hypothetical protein